MNEINRMPKIEKMNGFNTLIVDDAPFIILGGEIHNSSASNMSYMNEEVWPNLRNMNMNTVLVPVYWECIEPIEDQYDFSLVEAIINKAREEGLKIVFLWFGLWKNAESMYIPEWMKLDQEKYYLARKNNGEAINTISPLCTAAIEKDAKAYCELMNCIRTIDGAEHTVIMMQVENEIGLMGTDRDYGHVAQAAFFDRVPTVVEKAFNVRGNWNEAFGDEAGEYFSAYYFSKAVQTITRAGKEELGLPHYANAWLEQFPWRPGTYPSGGPVMKMQKMWNLIATDIEFLAPDIYVPYVPKVMDEYSRSGNTLFIPEVRKDAVASTYALYAIFGCHAIGFAPFGIEELQMSKDKIETIPMEVLIALNIDPSAFDIEGSGAYLRETYRMIESLNPLYYKWRGTDSLKVFVRKNQEEHGALLKFEDLEIIVKYGRKERFKPESGGTIIRVSETEFYIVGMRFSFEFLPKLGANGKINYLKVEEGEFIDGKWCACKILNGDEKMHLEIKDMKKMMKVKIYAYS